jgi:hypothetical protein
LLFFSAEYEGGISFSNRFYRFAVVIETVSFFLFVVCVFSMSCYIWVCARMLSRFIFFRVLSSGLTIAKMILFDFLPFEVFRDFFN